MSLQLIAKQMEAKGRNGDSVLVHMTPGEVAGLQKLAESAGGSLTVNPETGLVEANFLKRMLPTLVGLGVGAATMNPYAGAAAGAAVGGMQARRNDQDVLLGAAMGGLGGYGGASMGAGLGAAGNAATSQAATAANPAFMGPMPGAASGFDAAQAGLSSLGTEAGRGAFMSQVGGGAGLISDVGMAATPMMAPGKRPGDAPVDDELYSYSYNPGRTGAERNPMATSAERKYFDGGFSPMRKIRANQYGMAAGGLLSLAEGGPSGTSSEGMTGASKAAFDYLMGRSASSGSQGSVKGGSFSGGDGMYSFDPATGQYTRNPNYEDPEDKAKREREEREREEEERRRRNPPDNGPSDPPGDRSDYIEQSNKGIPSTQFKDSVYDYGNEVEQSNKGIPSTQFKDSVYDYGNEVEMANQGIPSTQFQDSVYDYGGSSSSDYGGFTDGAAADAAGGYGGYWKQGGLLGLAKGGMKSGGFVVPADVVSALGNGSTDAGLRKLYAMLGKVKPIKGKGDGLSDSIPTHIDGKQRAKVADGEAYIDPKTVKRLGGAKKLYAMMDKVRAQAHGKTSQQRPVNPAKVMA